MKKSHLLFILLAASVLNINAAEDLEFQEIQSKLRIIRQHNKKIRVTIENLENQEEAASIQIEKCNEILKSIPQEDYNKRLADINEELSIRSELSKAFEGEGEGEGEGQKQAQHDLIIQSLQSEKIDLLKHLVEAMHKKEEEENQRKIKEVATAKLVEWHALLRRASSVADELEKKAAQYLAKKRQDEEAERAAKAQAAKAKEAEKDPAEVLKNRYFENLQERNPELFDAGIIRSAEMLALAIINGKDDDARNIAQNLKDHEKKQLIKLLAVDKFKEDLRVFAETIFKTYLHLIGK